MMNRFCLNTFYFTTICLASILFLSRPTRAQEPRATTAVKDVQTLNKKSALDQNNLYQIIDITAKGELVISGLSETWQIHDPRFENMTTDQTQKMRDFMIGQFIKIMFPTINSGIVLPIELYNPGCFANDAAERARMNQCPVILEP